MDAKQFEDKFKTVEEGAATGAKAAVAWSQAHTSATLVLAGILVGLVLGFVFFH